MNCFGLGKKKARPLTLPFTVDATQNAAKDVVLDSRQDSASESVSVIHPRTSVVLAAGPDAAGRGPYTVFLPDTFDLLIVSQCCLARHPALVPPDPSSPSAQRPPVPQA